jgi:hypothetical protein
MAGNLFYKTASRSLTAQRRQNAKYTRMVAGDATPGVESDLQNAYCELRLVIRARRVGRY